MKRTALTFVVAAGVSLAGCSGLSPTEQRTLTGGALGAGAGAVIGALAGNAGAGAAIGGGVGLLGGYLSSQYKVVPRRGPSGGQ